MSMNRKYLSIKLKYNLSYSLRNNDFANYSKIKNNSIVKKQVRN